MTSRNSKYPRPSLRTNGSRECAPDDRLREAIHCYTRKEAGLLRRSALYASRLSQAMTRVIKTHLHILAARSARAMHDPFALKNRGRRESRVPAAPAAPRAKCRKHASASPQVHRNTRPSLRNGFNGFLRDLPGDRALLSPSLANMNSANLTPASRRQDHTTSPSASTRPRQKRHPRPPHPAPRP
jgi:hypothetical protein